MNDENEPVGVPLAEVTAHDFIAVRAALVARLGGPAEALVWTRVDYRVQAKSPSTVDDTGAWWAVSLDELADETGLSRGQVRRAIARLTADGYLTTTEHRLGGNFDRTHSYRTNVVGRDTSTCRIQHMDVLNPAHVPPLLRRIEEGGARVPRGTRIPDDFAVTDAMRSWAAVNVPRVDVDVESDAFVDYWRALGGARALKVDWLATWRRWMRRAESDRGPDVGLLGDAWEQDR